MDRRPWSGSLVALGLFALSALPLAAQAPARDDSFGEEIQVNVVNLDVFVSDKQGKPLEGLQASDFTVTEDGKPVKITNFYREKHQPAAGEGARAATAERPQDQRLRARSGIPEAWLLNLVRRALEVFRNPVNGVYQTRMALRRHRFAARSSGGGYRGMGPAPLIGSQSPLAGVGPRASAQQLLTLQLYVALPWIWKAPPPIEVQDVVSWTTKLQVPS